MTKPNITFTTVKSSNISATGYDEATQTLAIRFTNGGEYHYSGVPKKVAEEFNSAKSLGGFFAAKIRGKFTHTMNHNHQPKKGSKQ